jgi:hypothetical protein
MHLRAEVTHDRGGGLFGEERHFLTDVVADLEAVDEAADDVLVEGLVDGSGVDRRVEEVWCGGR